MVVLSACETALGKEVAGEGIVGLTRAFQYAGTPTVLASLWRVADQPTAVLMTRFYAGLKDGLPKDEALRQAQLGFIRGPIVIGEDTEAVERDLSHPFYWGGVPALRGLEVSAGFTAPLRGLCLTTASGWPMGPLREQALGHTPLSSARSLRRYAACVSPPPAGGRWARSASKPSANTPLSSARSRRHRPRPAIEAPGWCGTAAPYITKRQKPPAERSPHCSGRHPAGTDPARPLKRPDGAPRRTLHNETPETARREKPAL